MSTEKKLSFPQYHALQVLAHYRWDGGPLDRFLNLYCKNTPALGSHDRKAVSDIVYHLVRHFPPGTDWHGALFQKLPNIAATFPPWLFSLLDPSIATIFNEKAPLTLRINPALTTRAALKEELKSFDPIETPTSPLGLTLRKNATVFSLPSFERGAFEVQDEGSQLIALLCDAKPKQSVLDLCAGSGGKALAFAHRLEGTGQIYVHDIRAHVLLEAKKRFRRAKVQNVQFVPTEKLKRLKGRCDFVFADVPCSGTGTLRRNPDMKWRLTPQKLESLQAEQKAILSQAFEYAKEGGRVIYATCSVLACENEAQIAPYNVEKILRLAPQSGANDGFFAAVLLK